MTVEHHKEILRLRESTSFIGYEFLTWVFLLLDRDDREEQIAAITKGVLFKEEANIVLGQRLVTCLLNQKEQKTSVKSPILEASHEAFASIRNGHMVESLSIVIGISEISISLNLHAQDFAITQAQIKSNYGKDALTDGEEALDEKDQNHEEIFLRAAALDDAERVIQALYERFLALRLNESIFSSELALMRQQVDKRLGGYLAQPDPMNRVLGEERLQLKRQ